MIRKLNILVLSMAAIAPAFAADVATSEAKQVIALQNGEKLSIFKDGKMAKKNRFFARLIQQVLRNMRQKRVLP
jgi:hypothetical protein